MTESSQDDSEKSVSAFWAGEHGGMPQGWSGSVVGPAEQGTHQITALTAPRSGGRYALHDQMSRAVETVKSVFA